MFYIHQYDPCNKVWNAQGKVENLTTACNVTRELSLEPVLIPSCTDPREAKVTNEHNFVLFAYENGFCTTAAFTVM